MNNHAKYCKSKNAPVKSGGKRPGIVDPMDIILECCDQSTESSGVVTTDPSDEKKIMETQ